MSTLVRNTLLCVVANSSATVLFLVIVATSYDAPRHEPTELRFPDRTAAVTR